MIKQLLIAFYLLASGMAIAKPYTTNFLEFELPNGWECSIEGSEYVCQSTNDRRKKEAIIIFAAKHRGKQDDLTQYKAYLEQAKTFKLPGGKTQISEPSYTRTRKVVGQGHSWVDSLHLSSEVPGFYTRYMATVKGELGVAVTFSVAKEHYQTYKPIFDKIIETMQVFSRLKNNADGLKLAGNKGEAVPGASGDFLDSESGLNDIGVNRQRRTGDSGSAGDMTLYLILALVAGAAVFIAKNRKKKGTKKKKSKKKK